MSWEDCGFKPGKIHGPAKCDRQCGDCDGEHHFLVAGVGENEEVERARMPEGINPDSFFICKHCETYADMVNADERRLGTRHGAGWAAAETGTISND